MSSLLCSDNIALECKNVHSLIDKGEIIFIDEAYSNLLNLIHEFLDIFVKMTYEIGHSISKSNISKMHKLIESYNNMESFDILRKLKISTKVTEKHQQNERDQNFKIIFDSDS